MPSRAPRGRRLHRSGRIGADLRPAACRGGRTDQDLRARYARLLPVRLDPTLGAQAGTEGRQRGQRRPCDRDGHGATGERVDGGTGQRHRCAQLPARRDPYTGDASPGLGRGAGGAMAKSFQGGRAAQSGVCAAKLAALGYTGIPHVLEEPYGGFFSTVAISTQCDGAMLTAGLGDRWEILKRRLQTGASVEWQRERHERARHDHARARD